MSQSEQAEVPKEAPADSLAGKEAQFSRRPLLVALVVVGMLGFINHPTPEQWSQYRARAFMDGDFNRVLAADFAERESSLVGSVWRAFFQYWYILAIGVGLGLRKRDPRSGIPGKLARLSALHKEGQLNDEQYNRAKELVLKKAG